MASTSLSSMLVGNTIGNLYTSGGNTAITWCSINNYSASNVTANVHLVPDGIGTIANAQNQILTNLEILAGDTYQLYQAGEKILLSNGDMIQIVANASGCLSAVVSYTSY